MLFNSFHFMIFFPVVTLLYFIIPRKARYLWLLFASYYFYMSWNPKYAILIAISTCITYVSGLLLARIDKATFASSPRDNKRFYKMLCVAASFGSNLAILFFFKYFDFAVESLNTAFNLLHLTPMQLSFDVMLPVGISFYTFQALSYTMDVYRGELPAERNFFRYALFVSFFPQLVAGPIERSSRLLTQVDNIEKINLWNYERIANGLIKMVWGFFLKMVIADRIVLFVDAVFNQYWNYGSVELVLAAVGFAIQIYCDFASYSIIAIGAAEVMGFTLMENFNTPYFALNIRDFWKRWHISLSTWFRDYLYIPLGGNRKGKFRKYVNLMITFIASGLWHGADWNFVVWGGLHGIYQIVGEASAPLKQRFNKFFHTKTDSLGYRFGQLACTFILVNIAWIFFRSPSLRDATLYLSAMFTRWNPWVLFDDSLYKIALSHAQSGILLCSIGILLLVDLVQYFKKCSIDSFLSHQPILFRWGVLVSLIVAIFLFGQYGPNIAPQSFIYFQF